MNRAASEALKKTIKSAYLGKNPFASLLLLSLFAGGCSNSSPPRAPIANPERRTASVPTRDATTDSAQASLGGDNPPTATLKACEGLYSKRRRPTLDDKEKLAQAATTMGIQRGWDNKLATVAAYHAYDMAYRDYFSHRSPEGCDLSHRMLLLSPWRGGLVAEILAVGHTDLKSAMDAWMKSDDHKRHLLDKRYDLFGAAKSASATGNPFWVIIFGTQNPEPGQADPEADLGETYSESPSANPDNPPASTLSCPAGFERKVPQIGETIAPYCYRSGEVFHMPTAEESELCTLWGGGFDACRSTNWSERMYLSVKKALG